MTPPANRRVRTVVGEGRSREVSPYPDRSARAGQSVPRYLCVKIKAYHRHQDGVASLRFPASPISVPCPRSEFSLPRQAESAFTWLM